MGQGRIHKRHWPRRIIVWRVPLGSVRDRCPGPHAFRGVAGEVTNGHEKIDPTHSSRPKAVRYYNTFSMNLRNCGSKDLGFAARTSAGDHQRASLNSVRSIVRSGGWGVEVLRLNDPGWEVHAACVHVGSARCSG